jgi:hypothetical protein
VTQQGLNRYMSAGQRGSGDTKRDKTMLCHTVEQRIRSGGKSEGCRVREANASEPRNPSEMLPGTSLPAVKPEYWRPPSQPHAMSHAKRGAHSVTVQKPSPCSNRDFDWMDHRAWNRSTSYSGGLASLLTCSPQIAGPTGLPRPKLRIVSCPTCSFDSRRIRRLSQRKDTC